MVQSRQAEQAAAPPKEKGDGWAVNIKGSQTAHYFKAGPRGQSLSLCRMVRVQPVFLRDPSKHNPTCKGCVDVIERSGADNERKPLRDLQKRLSKVIAAFMADPAQGPRLYGCPVCGSIYEGRKTTDWFCSEGGHRKAVVIEIARKD